MKDFIKAVGHTVNGEIKVVYVNPTQVLAVSEKGIIFFLNGEPALDLNGETYLFLVAER